MTERHDPAPISPPPHGGDPSGRQPRVGGFVRVEGNRRRVPTAFAVGLMLAVAFGAVSYAVNSAVSWLHRRPEYLLDFQRIELVPDPPRSLRGGRSVILRKVRERAKFDEPIRLLSADYGKIKSAFALYSPWIAEVGRIDARHPGRLIVEVAYREPVGRIEIDSGRDLVVAGDCAVLPSEDLYPGDLARLPLLVGLKAVRETTAGLFLGANERGEIEARVASTVALARLFRRDPGRAEQFLQIDASKGEGNIAVLTRGGVRVFWGHGPGEEVDDEPAAARKLDLLDRWATSMKALDPPGPRRPERFVQIDVSKGADRIMVLGPRKVWVLWRHLPGEEVAGEPKAAEKIELLEGWERMHANRAVERNDYLEFHGDKIRLHSEIASGLDPVFREDRSPGRPVPSGG